MIDPLPCTGMEHEIKLRRLALPTDSRKYPFLFRNHVLHVLSPQPLPLKRLCWRSLVNRKKESWSLYNKFDAQPFFALKGQAPHPFGVDDQPRLRIKGI